jgi:hypothetical protein
MGNRDMHKRMVEEFLRLILAQRSKVMMENLAKVMCSTGTDRK